MAAHAFGLQCNRTKRQIDLAVLNLKLKPPKITIQGLLTYRREFALTFACSSKSQSIPRTTLLAPVNAENSIKTVWKDHEMMDRPQPLILCLITLLQAIWRKSWAMWTHDRLALFNPHPPGPKRYRLLSIVYAF